MVYSLVCFVALSCRGLPLTRIFSQENLHKKYSSELSILVKQILGKFYFYCDMFLLSFYSEGNRVMSN